MKGFMKKANILLSYILLLSLVFIFNIASRKNRNMEINNSFGVMFVDSKNSFQNKNNENKNNNDDYDFYNCLPMVDNICLRYSILIFSMIFFSFVLFSKKNKSDEEIVKETWLFLKKIVLPFIIVFFIFYFFLAFILSYISFYEVFDMFEEFFNSGNKFNSNEIIKMKKKIITIDNRIKKDSSLFGSCDSHIYAFVEGFNMCIFKGNKFYHKLIAIILIVSYLIISLSVFYFRNKNCSDNENISYSSDVNRLAKSICARELFFV